MMKLLKITAVAVAVVELIAWAVVNTIMVHHNIIIDSACFLIGVGGAIVITRIQADKL